MSGYLNHKYGLVLSAAHVLLPQTRVHLAKKISAKKTPPEQTCKSLFILFDQETEKLKKRTHDINDKINNNRLEHDLAMSDHDKALLASDEDEVARLRSKIERLDSDYGWLSREAELLTRAGPQSSPVLKELAQKWQEQASQEANELRHKWGKQLTALEDRWHHYLEAVNILGRIADQCDDLQFQYGVITETTKLSLKWLDLPHSNIDCGLQRGQIFKDQKTVAETFKKGHKK